ncbi:MAG TPA: PQQ-binding-like beta-propeller repeat protein [Acidimicrobiia bacterium]|nr:PQQ-binding-like beta-propeller repeat protein [Acidimicrobiia bacterium]
MTATPAFAGSSWPVYHGDGQRTGNDTTEPGLLPLHGAWSATLDGAVYGQPVVFAGRVFAATENDTVYALDAHDGHVLWARHAGLAMTNVHGQVGCGNIDPLGITSSMVIDMASKTLFAVATIQDSFGHIHHQLEGFDAISGATIVSANADPGGAQNPLYIQQRAALALGNGRIYIGYGGYAGDCGPYHGWLVSLTEAGTAKLAFDVAPHDGAGAIWEPGGPAIDGAGDVYVGTGNNDPHVGTGDFGESVLKLDANLHRLANFSSSNATGDADLGTTTPALVGGSMVFEIGKQNVGYLLDAGNLHELQHVTACPTSEAKGADAFDGSHLFVPCDAGIQEVNIDTVHRSMSLGWTGPSTSAAGPPVLAGGALWYVDSGNLYALNPASGATMSGFPISIGSTPHFASPSTALGLLLIGTRSGVSAYAGPAGVPPHAPSACTPPTNHTGYWIASSDGNVIPFGGAPSCGSLVGISLSAPVVGMAATPSGNGYWLVASDGGIFAFGDAHFRGSMGGHPLDRPVVGMTATPSGNGYWLVASDGGILAFGDARFGGSTGNLRLWSPIVGMTNDGRNAYWFTGGDGGVFAFGVPFWGSAAGQTGGAPAVAIAHD